MSSITELGLPVHRGRSAPPRSIRQADREVRAAGQAVFSAAAGGVIRRRKSGSHSGILRELVSSAGRCSAKGLEALPGRVVAARHARHQRGVEVRRDGVRCAGRHGRLSIGRSWQFRVRNLNMTDRVRTTSSPSAAALSPATAPPDNVFSSGLFHQDTSCWHGGECGYADWIVVIRTPTESPGVLMTFFIRTKSSEHVS